jgi:alkanesulfonate monooxygenase SsuD/methylene tetrahydromethanopterin reductase-like flavin-dependent oxidoreductase (luciferase family)
MGGEARGIHAVSLPDHYLYGTAPFANPAPDALTQIAGLARETDRVELSTLVSPVTFRHPAVFAKTAITLDRMSGGRFTLGLGTGWMDAEHEIFGFPYPPMAERFELLEEHLAYVRTAITPGESSYEGSHFSLQPIELHPPASHGPKLVVGGGGPNKTPRLAGTYGDEFNVYA